MLGKVLARVGVGLSWVGSVAHSLWFGYQRWASASVIGKVVEHSAVFVVIAGLYRITYEALHFLLPNSGWSGAIEFVEGFVMFAIFVALSIDVLAVVGARVWKSVSGHDTRSIVFVSAL